MSYECDAQHELEAHPKGHLPNRPRKRPVRSLANTDHRQIRVDLQVPPSKLYATMGDFQLPDDHNFGTVQYNSAIVRSLSSSPDHHSPPKKSLLPTSLADIFTTTASSPTLPPLALQALFRNQPPHHINDALIAPSREPAEIHRDLPLANKVSNQGIQNPHTPAVRNGHIKIRKSSNSSQTPRPRASTKSLNNVIIHDDATPKPKSSRHASNTTSRTNTNSANQQPVALDLFQPKYNTVTRRQLDELISEFQPKALPDDHQPHSPAKNSHQLPYHQKLLQVSPESTPRINKPPKTLSPHPQHNTAPRLAPTLPTPPLSTLYPPNIDDLEDVLADHRHIPDSNASRQVLIEGGISYDDMLDGHELHSAQNANNKNGLMKTPHAASSASQSESPTKKRTLRLIRNMNGKSLSALMSKLGTTSGMVFNEETKRWEGGESPPLEMSDKAVTGSSDAKSVLRENEVTGRSNYGYLHHRLPNGTMRSAGPTSRSPPGTTIAVDPSANVDKGDARVAASPERTDVGVIASPEKADAATSPLFLNGTTLFDRCNINVEAKETVRKERNLNHHNTSFSGHNSVYDGDRADVSFCGSTLRRSPIINLNVFGEAIMSLANWENSLIIPSRYDNGIHSPKHSLASTTTTTAATRSTSINTLTSSYSPSVSARMKPPLETYHRRGPDILPLLMSLPDLVRQRDWMSVQRLDLRYQQVITTKGLSVFMPNLEELDLTSNQVQELVDLPESIRVLRVAGNKIPSSTILSIYYRLEVLDLSRNDLSRLPDISGLLFLRLLRAHGNRMKSCAGLRGCTNLRILDLSDNELTNVDALQFTEKLESLWLHGNRISKTDETVRILQGLKELQLIDLRDNPMTAAFYTTYDDVMSRSSSRLSRISVTSQHDLSSDEDQSFIASMPDSLDGSLITDTDRDSAKAYLIRVRDMAKFGR
ncbi:hypothetical protein SeMB42_g04313 [Synchytrium endobioticum]|uniref:Uncharacterized protein n=1 Tax=Synchytrium endobioticum TaxID=286115 RepID=A0A507CZK4_9FUNG|nr:hypothetical protein SeMB42_g04313 [Synchytrium endobioticum]